MCQLFHDSCVDRTLVTHRYRFYQSVCTGKKVTKSFLKFREFFTLEYFLFTSFPRGPTKNCIFARFDFCSSPVETALSRNCLLFATFREEDAKNLHKIKLTSLLQIQRIIHVGIHILFKRSRLDGFFSCVVWFVTYESYLIRIPT